MKSFIIKFWFVTFVSLFMFLPVFSQSDLVPVKLNVNRLFNTEQTFLNGYLISTPLNESISQRESFQFVEISTHKPQFGWIIDATTNK